MRWTKVSIPTCFNSKLRRVRDDCRLVKSQQVQYAVLIIMKSMTASFSILPQGHLFFSCRISTKWWRVLATEEYIISVYDHYRIYSHYSISDSTYFAWSLSLSIFKRSIKLTIFSENNYFKKIKLLLNIPKRNFD